MPNNRELVNRLETIIENRGAAQVAAWLNYRDSRAVKAWVQRRRIPKHMELLVEKLINKVENQYQKRGS